MKISSWVIVAKQWRKLYLSDVLLRPTRWSDGYFGTYSKVKHRFMMEQTGLKWDDEYLEIVPSDVSMGYYWQENSGNYCMPIIMIRRIRMCP